MRQKFGLVAPKAKMYSFVYGKLKNILFDDSAEELVRLLVVPVRPRKPLATATATTTQVPSDCLAGNSAERQVPSEAPADSQRQCKMTESDDSSVRIGNNRSVSFCDFPVEIHRLILGHLDIVDVLHLGVLTEYFWCIARDFLHIHFMACLGGWAGKSIVCVGGDVEAGDYTPGLFTADEVEELNKKTIWSHYDNFYHNPTHLFTLADFNWSYVSRMDTSINMYTESLRLEREAWGGFQHPANHPLFSDMPADVDIESIYTPTDQTWVLRNLTTKEFVRPEAIALKPEFIRGPLIRGIGFGEVVMSRICWTTGPAAIVDGSIDISRGVWAGHCFNITTLASCEEEIKGAEWRDVSEEVLKEIATIWESVYGPGWRETLCEDCMGYQLI